MAERPDRRAARLRRLRASRPGYSAAKNAKWNAANPEKRRAHKRVEYAVKVGRLVRQPCEACGDEKVTAHHDDYSKPLEVRWLCRPHHEAADAALKI